MSVRYPEDFDHYHAASRVSRLGTLEIRIFRGNVAKRGFHRALEFIDAMVRFCRQASATSLNIPAFLGWFIQPSVRKSYPALEDWLIRNHHIVVKKRLTDEKATA